MHGKIYTKGFFLPGYTQAPPTPEVAEYLEKRGYHDPEGGAEIADIFHRSLIDNKIDLVLGGQGFVGLKKTTDQRNLILSSCLRNNCQTAIRWLVEYEGGPGKWALFAGVWNARRAYMVLDAPAYHENPVIWLSEQIDQVEKLLDLSLV